MKKFLDTDHPFFRPLWIRVLIVVICAAWGIVEFVTGSPFWGTIFLGLGAYSAWGFFIDFDPDRANPKDDTPKADTPKDDTPTD